MDPRHDPNLILGYLEGDLTPDDQAKIEALRTADPDFAALLDGMQSDRQLLQSATPAAPPAGLTDIALAGLERSMLLDNHDAIAARPTRRSRFRLAPLLTYGGIAAVLALTAGAVLNSLRPPEAAAPVANTPASEPFDIAQAPIQAQREIARRDRAAVAFDTTGSTDTTDALGASNTQRLEKKKENVLQENLPQEEVALAKATDTDSIDAAGIASNSFADDSNTGSRIAASKQVAQAAPATVASSAFEKTNTLNEADATGESHPRVAKTQQPTTTHAPQAMTAATLSDHQAKTLGMDSLHDTGAQAQGLLSLAAQDSPQEVAAKVALETNAQPKSISSEALALTDIKDFKETESLVGASTAIMGGTPQTRSKNKSDSLRISPNTQAETALLLQTVFSNDLTPNPTTTPPQPNWAQPLHRLGDDWTRWTTLP